MIYPKISIVVLNWNSKKDSEKLLQSIYSSSYPKNKIEVILVDNGSTDCSAFYLKGKFPQARIINKKENVGVSARNYAFKIIKGDIVFTIDSDIVITKSYFKKVVDVFQNNKNNNIGIIGTKIVDKKSKKNIESRINFNLYTGTIKISKSNNFTFLGGYALAYSKKLLEKNGYYDKNYFFYGEDIDYCIRAKKAGFKIVYLDNVVAYHGKSSETPDIPSSIKYHYYYQSLFYTIFKHGTFIQKISSVICQLLVIPFYFIISGNFRLVQIIPRLWGLNKNIPRVFVFFMLLLIFSSLFKIILAIQKDFWYDEAFTYHISKLPIRDLLKAVASDNNPPLYYLIEKLALNYNSSELTLRSVSIIVSVITSLLLYKKVNKTSAAFFLISPLSIYLSTEARLHSFSIIFTLLLINELNILKKNKRKSVIIPIILTTLSFYSQYYFVILSLSLVAYSLIKKNRQLVKKTTIIFLTSTFLFLPWIIFSSRFAHNQCSCPNTLLSLPAALLAPLINGVGNVSMRNYISLPIYILLPFILISLISTIIFIKRLNSDSGIIYLFTISMLSLVGLVFPVFSPKAFSVFLPLYFIILTSRINNKNIKLFKLIFALLLYVSFVENANPFFYGDQIKNSYNITQTNKSLPIAHTSLSTYYSFKYYSRNNTQSNILITTNPLNEKTIYYLGGDKIEIQNHEFWLIDTPKWVNDIEYENIKSKLRDQYSTIESHPLSEKILVSRLLRI